MTKCKSCGYEFEDEDIVQDQDHGGPICTDCHEEAVDEKKEYTSEQEFMDAENPNY